MNNRIFNLKRSEKISDLYITGVIGDHDIWNDEGVVFNQFKAELEKAVTSERVRLFINSPGGYVYDGIAIFDLIKNLSKDHDIEIHVSGLAASIASVIMLSVPINKRFISNGSTVMIHNPSLCVCGGVKDLETNIKELNSITNSIAQIYQENTNLDFDQSLNMMEQETYFSAVEADKFGFANISDDFTTSNKKDIRDFVKNVKQTCSMEQRNTKKNDVPFEKISQSTNLGKDQMSDTTSKKTEDSSIEDRISALEEESKVQKAKLEIDAKQITDLKEQLEKVTNERDEAVSKLESSEQNALEKVLADIEQASALKEKVKNSGYEEISGNSVLEVKRNVLAKGGISKPELFEGEALDNLFEDVLKRAPSKVEKDHDEAFKVSNNKPEKVAEFIRPSRKTKRG